MPIHGVLGRAALLVVFLWLSGGVVAIRYYVSHWTGRGHGSYTRFASSVEHVAPRVQPASTIEFAHPAEAGLVTVVIPTFNRAGIVGRAIETALEQTYQRIQVLIADDGSSDNTRQIADAYGPRVTYTRQANSGVSAARNFGMRNARGEFIAFLDSDDRWLPWKIEAQIEALNRNPRAGLVWTDMEAVDENDRVLDSRYLRQMYSAYDWIDLTQTLPRVGTLGEFSSSVPDQLSSAAVHAGDISAAIMLGNLIHTSTVLFRRSWCAQTGGFDESYERAGEDYEFYIRLSSVGPVVFIDAPSTLYRIGAADQLTAPSMILEIARNNLRAVETWLPGAVAKPGLSEPIVRRRLSESLAWAGEAELDAGHRIQAVRRLSKSLAVMPALDKRALLLASCALPAKVRDGLYAIRHSADES